MIAFKTPEIRAQWESGKVDARLRAVVLCVEGMFSRNAAGITVLINDIYRPAGTIPGESGMHATWCAADVCTKSIPSALVAETEATINTLFRYGIGNDGRKHEVAWYHDAGRGWHLHLQVPPPAMKPEVWEGFALR